MADERVSSILLTQGDQLFGLVTDRDLRTRVLAHGVDPARPGGRHRHAGAADAAEAPVHLRGHGADGAAEHPPRAGVLDGTRVAGMVTATDLNQQQAPPAVYLTGDIYRQPDLAGLVACSLRVKDLQSSLAKAETNAYSTGIIMTSVTDAFHSAPDPAGRRRNSWARRRWTTAGWPPARRRAWSRRRAPTRTAAWCCPTTTGRRSVAVFPRLLQVRLRRTGRLRLRALPRRDDGHGRQVASAAAGVEPTTSPTGSSGPTPWR